MPLLLANLAASGMMIGLVWVVQMVHYPLFAAVGPEAWPAYAKGHGRWISVLVLPWMTVELVTAVALVRYRPDAITAPEAWLGLALVGVLWASTWLLQGPLFSSLAAQWDPSVHRRLVLTNWIRTFAWTARGVLLLVVIGRVLLRPVG